MSEQVTCRVCGCECPLGTAECPDCGAPLPQTPTSAAPEAAAPADPFSPGTSSTEAAPEAPEVPTVSPKRRRMRFLAAAVAACLVLALAAAAFWPRQPKPFGVALVGETLISTDGVWDFSQDGLTLASDSCDGRHWLLRCSEGQTKTKTKTDASSVPLRGALELEQNAYYLYNGQTLEYIGQTYPYLTAKALFRVKVESGSRQLLRRDLKTGKTTTLDESEQGGELAIIAVAQDGTAVVYTKHDRTDGVDETFLWAEGKGARAIDCPGSIYAVSSGGKRCLFWGGTNWSDAAQYGSFIDYSTARTQDGVWQDDGQIFEISGGMLYNYNADFTEFIYRDYNSHLAGDWYYYTLGGEPVHLSALENGWLEAIPVAGGGGNAFNYYYSGVSVSALPDTLCGRFYLFYDGRGGNTVYYLTRDGEFTFVENGLGYDGIYTDQDAGQVLYLLDGDLYRISADQNGTVATEPLTSSGKVAHFNASADLKYIYYYQTDDPAMSFMLTMYRWHGGKTENLGMELNRNYGTGYVAIDEAGNCYFTYTRCLYFAPRNGTPEQILENAGSNPYLLRVTGEETWYLLYGARWKDGGNKSVYWRLNGNKVPEELPVWQPEEEQA